MTELLLAVGYLLIGALTGGAIYATTDDDPLRDGLPQEFLIIFGSIFWPGVPFVLAGVGFGRLLKGIKERRLALAEQRERHAEQREREAVEAENEIRKVLGS